MRYHYRFNLTNTHLEFLDRARFNIKKMFISPKSKSPWEAMTAGSTGGWAKGLEPWGPAINTALGAVPVVGPALSIGGGLIGMAGKGTGFQGTDKGFGGNILPMLGGGLAGYGLGSLGGGLKGGIQGLGAGTGFMSGAKGGMGGYFGTPIIPGMGGTSGTNIWKGVQGIGKNLLGGFGDGGQGGGMFGGGGGLGGATGGMTSGVGTGQNPFTWQNIMSKVLGGGQGSLGGGQGFGGRELLGAGLLGASAMQKPPTLGQSQQDFERAQAAVNAPNLVQARDLIRQMALANPSELVNPASDKYIEATLRQSRQAFDRAQQETINTYSARGKTLQGSGALNERLARMGQEQQQLETDYITKVQESRYLAGIKLKVDAVAKYFNVAEQEALQLLASYGYINDIDMTNYLAELQAFNNLQMVQGLLGSSLYMGNQRTSMF